MEDLSPFKPLPEALELLKTSFGRFDKNLAPRRFKKLERNIEEKKSLGFRGAIVIYGLRRTGKTAAVIELGKRAMNNAGYTVFYTDLDSPEFDPEGDAMKSGRILRAASLIASLAKKQKKVLVIVDEAFVGSMRVIHKFLEKFKSLYDEKREFSVILLGSYGVDIERIRAYLYRTIPAKGFPPIILSLPRACVKRKFLSVDLIEALTFDSDSPGRRTVIKELSNAGLFKDGFVGNEAREIYEKYTKTLGMPEALIGVKEADEILEEFPSLVEESIARFKSIVKASKDEAMKYRLITYPKVMERIIKNAGTLVSLKNLSEEEMKLIEFSLNLGILLPRRYIDDPKNLEEEAFQISFTNLGDLLETRKFQPIPAHLFAYELIDKLSKVYKRGLNAGMKYEAITAHAIIEHAVRRNAKVMLTRLPIFSTKGIDFLYRFVDSYGATRYALIEVKTGSVMNKIIKSGEYVLGENQDIDNAIKTAEALDAKLTFVTDTDEAYLGRKTIKVEGSDVTVYAVPIEIFFSAVSCLKRFYKILSGRTPLANFISSRPMKRSIASRITDRIDTNSMSTVEVFPMTKPPTSGSLPENPYITRYNAT